MSNSDRWTAKRLSAMEKRLKIIYSQAYKDLDEKTKAHFAKMAEMDEKKKKLVEDGKLSQEEYERWRRTQLFQGQQMQAMTDTVAKELLKVNQTAIAYVNSQLPSVYTVNYNDAGKDIAGKVSGYSFQLYDEQTVMNLATENKTLLPYKQVNGKKDVRWNTKQVNAQVLQGIIQGESIPKIAKRLENVTGMNRVSAIRNARTSVTSAQNKGRIDSYKQAQKDGVILKKQWLAANQPGRTRDWHAELNEKEAEVDEPFKNSFGEIMYPGDPHAKPQNVYNCRCTLVSIVKGFKKVGENTAENVDNTAESGIIKEKKNTAKITKKSSTKQSVKTLELTSQNNKNNTKIGSENFSSEIRKKILQQEQINNGNKYETALIYDSNGNLKFKVKGDRSKVQFSKNQVAQLKGCVVSHNHPLDSCLSSDDIFILKTTKATEVRASTSFGTYVINPPDEWDPRISTFKEMDEAYNNYVDKYIIAYKDKAAQEGKPLLYYLQKAEEDGVRAFAKEYGFKFRKDEYL